MATPQSVGCITSNDGMEVDGQPSQAKRQLYIGQDGVNYKRKNMEASVILTPKCSLISPFA